MFAAASLPMYDWPEIRSFTDQFWKGFARHAGLAGALDRRGSYSDLWRNPNLIFGQTCGYPFSHEFKGILKAIATPHYAVNGCVGPRYSSVVFARRKYALEELRGARPAFNNPDSMSGMLALKVVFAALNSGGEFFAPAIVTGGHLESLAAMQAKTVDVCAIDAVCVALAGKYRPHLLEGLHEIARSPLVPGLPFVTRAGDVEKLRHALRTTFEDKTLKEAREGMLLSGHSILTPADYDIIPQLEAAL
jgi:ABC-type phosphate/phosphonate transport system substrate-binding protein